MIPVILSVLLIFALILMIVAVWKWDPKPDPPCTNTKCTHYGAKYCPCADIDAWSMH